MVLKITNLHILRYLPTYRLYLLECYTIDNQRCTHIASATKVQHNVKLEGKSGQKHQIDVYWEYEIAGVTHKVAIECKNYNKPIAIGKVRDFYGVLADLNNVAGIIVTKAGFQKGTIQFVREHGISLKELRNPTREECIIGEVITTTSANIRHTLFLVDEEWATKNGYDFQAYRRRLNLFRGED